MLLTQLIMIIFVILAFCVIVYYFSNLYISTKLYNQGVDKKLAGIIAQNMSLLMTFFYGIMIFILVFIAAQTFSGGVIL